MKAGGCAIKNGTHCLSFPNASQGAASILIFQRFAPDNRCQTAYEDSITPNAASRYQCPSATHRLVGVQSLHRPHDKKRDVHMFKRKEYLCTRPSKRLSPSNLCIYRSVESSPFQSYVAKSLPSNAISGRRCCLNHLAFHYAS